MEVVQLLLDAAALPGSAPSGAVPLLLAASQGHREVVQCLLWAEADPEARKGGSASGLAGVTAKRNALLLPLRGSYSFERGPGLRSCHTCVPGLVAVAA